jgi:class 3 adenylate cyclase
MLDPLQLFTQFAWRKLEPLMAAPANVARYDYRMYQSMIMANYIAFALHFSWIFVFAYLGFPTLSWINVASVVFWTFSIYMLRHWGAMLTAVVLGSVEVLIHQYLAVYYLGWDYGFQYYLLVIVAFTFLMNFRHVMYIPVALFLVCLTSFLGLYYQVQYWNLPHVDLGATARETFLNVNVSSAFAILAIMSYVYSEAAQKAEALLELERLKSDRLLLNILPEPIAQRLKEDKSRIADFYESTTVLFSDIVGFTEMSKGISAEELVGRLNGIFCDFDELAEKYQLEKIKTIGDAYMVAGGFPAVRDYHAQDIAAMALEMLEVLKSHAQASGAPITVRIGIHTGPAVAGVIGTKKFAYDVWGDTVNTASRMESSSLPGRIQITEQVAALLEDAFVIEERGSVEIKGKGPMKTYWLVGHQSAQPPQPLGLHRRPAPVENL